MLKRDFIVGGGGVLAPVIEFYEQLNALMFKQLVYRLGIVRSIQEYNDNCARGESLLEFSRADDQADGIMPRGRIFYNEV
ncbi:hypothetical protein [Paenibacillus agaridevorans]|uniref:hypothetical protein n=1 Tax=Paenibacillus agaridevorans TaxID=171404 RepID=UPI001BE4B37C|nr:hypothetical protein [Paenibacillus agaridevorans]